MRSTLLRLDRLFTASCSQWVSGWVGGPEYRDYVMIYANDTFIQYIYIHVCMYVPEPLYSRVRSNRQQRDRRSMLNAAAYDVWYGIVFLLW